jgi:hypothetical protein
LVDTSPSGGVALEMLGELASLPAGAGAPEVEKAVYVWDALMVIFEDWGWVKHNFELLNRKIKTQGVLESKFRDVLASMISSPQAVVHDSDSKIQLLASRIGEMELPQMKALLLVGMQQYNCRMKWNLSKKHYQ